MPASDYHHITDVLHVVQQTNPATLLDVGVGFGKWGTLCREVLEVYNHRVEKESWIGVIDGIEIHEPYRNELWGFAYNRVYQGDAFEVIDGLGHYDLILCCDVIEHLDKADGFRFIDKLLAHGCVVVITSPRGFYPQGAVCGNQFERHRSGWSRDDFRNFAHIYKDAGFTFVAVLARDREQLRGVSLPHPLRVFGVKRGARELFKLSWQRLQHRIGMAHQ